MRRQHSVPLQKCSRYEGLLCCSERQLRYPFGAAGMPFCFPGIKIVLKVKMCRKTPNVRGAHGELRRKRGDRRSALKDRVQGFLSASERRDCSHSRDCNAYLTARHLFRASFMTDELCWLYSIKALPSLQEQGITLLASVSCLLLY